jgi:DNA-binding CsgD family transcriptional regulator/tetratricopeptide (TPR) repeat protein
LNVRIPQPVCEGQTSTNHTTDAAGAGLVGSACFVGRQFELAELLRVLRRAATGTGGVAILEGEPGIGKTRTAEEFAGMARGRGATVLWGRCFEGEECPPYGPWVTALHAGIRSVELPKILREVGREGAVIAEILPELRLRPEAAEAPVRLSPVDGEYRLHASLATFLRAAARSTLLLVVLDNLHLADAGSLKFLRHLAPELSGSRLMILGTFRGPPEGRADLVTLTVDELRKARDGCRLRLDGLCRNDVRELLARSLSTDRTSDAMADAIHARTEGNPLFVVELVRRMAREPAPAGGASPLPDGIRQTIERRLRRLSHRSRDVLEAASVLGRSFDQDILIRTAVRCTAADVEDALREAEQAAVVSVEDPAVGRYRFVHALVQETLREAIPPNALVESHIRAARVIRLASGPDPGPRSVEILGHLLDGASAAEPDELLRGIGEAAQHAITHYAPDHALALIDRTLRTWERLGRGIEPRMASLFHLRGTILTDLERPEEARECLERAFDLYLEAGDRRCAIEVALTPTMERSGTLWLASVGGSGRGIVDLRERALELAPEGTAERTWLAMQRGSRRDLREAVAFAGRTGEDQLAAAASSVLAYHELLAYEFDACAEILEEATRSAARLHDPHVSFGCAYTRYWLGILTGRPEAGVEGLRQMTDLAEWCRSRRLRITAHRCQADLAGMRGDWRDARHHGEQALALMGDTGPVFNHDRVLRVLLYVALFTGNLKTAARRLTAMHRLRGEPGPDDPRTTLLGARITGEAALLPPAPEVFDVPDADGPLLTFLPYPLLKQATVVALHRDSSKAGFYFAAARRWSGTYFDQPTDGILGMLCDVMGRFDEAAALYERALELCRRAGYLPELAMTCSEYAGTLARRSGPGDHAHAVRLLDEGLALCGTLDMPVLGQRIRERRGLLAGPELPRQPRTEGLTPREAKVLGLVARGFTNAEIAERLFISPLTVARHVHNLLEKTGTANRAEAAAYAVRCGLSESCRTIK